MAKYELDDELVQKFISHQDSAGWVSAAADELAVTLERQLSAPVPTKIGAVVKTVGAVYPTTGQPVTFVRWALDHFTHSPWLQANSDIPYRTDEIGRIIEVLSQGVDL